MKDLFPDGTTYDGRNKWNCNTQTSAVHLIQKANTLGAEVELGGATTVVRAPGGNVITDSHSLITCAKYGQATRISDPSIGSAVNSFARSGYKFCLANPVALYFEDFSPDGWKTPGETDPNDFWTIKRGPPGMAVRYVYEVPEEKPYVVRDITFAPDHCIAYGSQIADFIRIKLTGMVYDMNPENVTEFKCCKTAEQGHDLSTVPKALAGGVMGRMM